VRQLRRPAVALPTLSGAGKGAAKAASHLQEKTADPSAELKFPDHWNEPDVRGALYAMHGWVCAYCQCALPRNDRGDVEHFRPKDGGDEAQPLVYWWLAYDLENYLLACSVCNSGRKGGRFPLEPGASPVPYATREELAEEARLLVDPAEDPVEAWMRVDWMDPEERCLMKERPSLDATGVAYRRVRETIRFFRLNEDPGLYHERRLALGKVTRAHKRRDRDKASRLASRYRAHGMAVRNFLYDNEPSWLPSRREELGFLLDEVHERLESAIKLLNTGPEDVRLCRRMIEELCWVLAVLWKAPPPETFTPDEIEGWLVKHGFRGLVAPMFARLK
jgi:hypothetical protein